MCASKTNKKKNFRRHKKSKTHLIIAGEKVKCKICKSLYDPNGKQAYHQSIEQNFKKLKCDVCDLSID